MSEEICKHPKKKGNRAENEFGRLLGLWWRGKKFEPIRSPAGFDIQDPSLPWDVEVKSVRSVTFDRPKTFNPIFKDVEQKRKGDKSVLIAVKIHRSGWWIGAKSGSLGGINPDELGPIYWPNKEWVYVQWGDFKTIQENKRGGGNDETCTTR